MTTGFSRCAVLALVASLPSLSASAANQLVNPEFQTNLSGWTVVPQPGVTASHDPSMGYPVPGSLRVAVTGPTALNYVVVRQCVSVTPGAVYDFGGRYRFASGQPANLLGFASVAWFTDAGCTTGGQNGPSSNTVANLPDTWLPIHANNVTAPPGVNSAYFLLVIAQTTGAGLGWFDQVYFGPDPLAVDVRGLAIE